MFVVGGFSKESKLLLNEMWSFDVDSFVWTYYRLAGASNGRYYFPLVSLPDNSLLIFGGRAEDSEKNDMLAIYLGIYKFFGGKIIYI